jgi:8-oxo-dGTP pyrophosphatase MutT (NUDIX family)
MEPRRFLPARPGAGVTRAGPGTIDLSAIERYRPGRIRGDHDLNGGHPAGSLRQAAVLVPIVSRPEGQTVLLTQRTAHLHAHAGQISFPGGRVDRADADSLAAALRETQEEIGLAPAHVRILGQLDTYVTRTGFEVVPHVGDIRPPFDLVPDAFEVADVFEVPLAFFLSPGQPQTHSRTISGVERFFYAFPYQARYIWGATAGMLRNLREVLLGIEP